MKETFYFSHDANARHDPKISAMICRYGMAGYGMYWILIEMLREDENHKLPAKEYIWSAIALQMLANAEQIKTYVNDLINEFDLLRSDGSFFWSESLIRRMKKKEDISKVRSEAARKRYENQSLNNNEDTNAMQMYANAEQLQCKISNKVKESKINNRFTPPTIEDVRAVCLERGNGVDPERFVAFYESKGWMIGRNKMKDWKAALRTWENRNDAPVKKSTDWKMPENYNERIRTGN